MAIVTKVINDHNATILFNSVEDGAKVEIIFKLNGKQYVSFVSTGGYFHNFKKKGSTVYTFTVSD